jgi:6-hydroxycyclohex-1-ene-1-carbonyl-CoA dehydrogenase
MSITTYRWTMNGVNEPLTRQEFLAQPGAGEVVVEVAGCGVCHTDLGFFYDGVRTNSALPLALGHEISGRVVAAGEGVGDWLNKAVIIPAVMPCGECDLCRRGKGTICRSQKMPGNDIQGGFASHIVVPARDLCPVDETRLKAAGLELADVSVVADAVTTPYQAVHQAGVTPGSLAIVIGVGGVGGYCVQMAKAFGASVVAIDIDQEKLDSIAAHGAAKTFNSREISGRDLKKAISAYAKEQSLPSTEWFIFECSGSKPGQETAYGLMVHGATLSVVGFTMDTVDIRLSNLMAFHARALGNWGCLPEHYPAALDLVLDGKIELKAFTKQLPLAEINAVFAAVHGKKMQQRAILVP